ncbi:MAG: PLP-dependent cysteine synthase family protein [Hyphomicrobiaceae bacterium]
MRRNLALKTLAAMTGWSRARIYNDIAETIGHTPLVRAARLAAAANVHAEILVKLEFLSPLASIKDRVAVAVVDALEADRRLVPGKTALVAAVSGNMAASLAFVAAARGYRLTIVAPDSLPSNDRNRLARLGAELDLIPAAEGPAAAAARAADLAKSLPDAVQLNPLEDAANSRVHEMTTAEELWADTGGRIDVLVAGVGSGGTLTGCARMLKPRLPDLKVVAVEPAASAVLSGGEPNAHGIEGLGLGFVPALLDRGAIDEVVRVSDDMAFEAARWLARIEGIAGGLSTGANMSAALTVAGRPEMAGKTIVTFAPSPAERHASSES